MCPHNVLIAPLSRTRLGHLAQYTRNRTNAVQRRVCIEPSRSTIHFHSLWCAQLSVEATNDDDKQTKWHACECNRSHIPPSNFYELRQQHLLGCGGQAGRLDRGGDTGTTQERIRREGRAASNRSTKRQIGVAIGAASNTADEPQYGAQAFV